VGGGRWIDASEKLTREAEHVGERLVREVELRVPKDACLDLSQLELIDLRVGLVNGAPHFANLALCFSLEQLGISAQLSRIVEGFGLGNLGLEGQKKRVNQGASTNQSESRCTNIVLLPLGDAILLGQLLCLARHDLVISLQDALLGRRFSR